MTTRKSEISVPPRRLRILITGLLVGVGITVASPPALSKMCNDVEPSSELGILCELFTNSQRAERSSERDEGERTDCSENLETIVPSVSDQPPIPVLHGTVEKLNSVLKDHINKDFFVEQHESNSNRLYAGCPIKIVGINFDLAVEMSFFRPPAGPDIVKLKIVGRNEGTDQTWVPLVGSDGTIALPGTSWEHLVRQPAANFVGEQCVFPAARYVLYAMCTPQHDGDEGASGAELSIDQGGPTVVGHSLGGAATQYIAISGPPDDLPNVSPPWRMCPSVNAYAFGSIGLSANAVGENPIVNGSLRSYIASCDWLTGMLFRSNLQTGHVLTLTAGSHSINGIQSDLCKCLQGRGNLTFRDYGLSGIAQSRASLCLKQARVRRSSRLPSAAHASGFTSYGCNTLTGDTLTGATPSPE